MIFLVHQTRRSTSFPPSHSGFTVLYAWNMGPSWWLMAYHGQQVSDSAVVILVLAEADIISIFGRVPERLFLLAGLCEHYDASDLHQHASGED